jgi:hypothetical protein
MRRNLQYVFLCVPFLAMTFLTVWLAPHRTAPQPAPLLLDNWDVPQLAAYLNGAGVEVRTVPTQKDAVGSSSAYLTATQKDWSDLNRLMKDASKIHEWRGTVYCARETANSNANLARPGDEHYLLVGPFIFYGDAELLARIDAALNHSPAAQSP